VHAPERSPQRPGFFASHSFSEVLIFMRYSSFFSSRRSLATRVASVTTGFLAITASVACGNSSAGGGGSATNGERVSTTQQADTSQNANVGDGLAVQLGSGWSDVAENVTGPGLCLTDPKPITGVSPTSGGGLTLSRMTSSDVSSGSFGFSASGKGKFGVVNAGAAANFTKEIQGDDYTDVFLFGVDFELTELQFSGEETFTSMGKAALAQGTFQTTCGDEAVSGVKYGGRFFAAVKVHWDSTEQKTKWDASANGSGFFGIEAMETKLTNADATLAQHSQISVEVHQFGGNTARLGKVLAGATLGDATNGQNAQFNCTGTQSASCGNFVKSVIDYVANDFSQQFGDPADAAKVHDALPLSFTKTPWSQFPGITQGTRIVTQEITGYRQQLSKLFDPLWQSYVRLNNELEYPHMPPAVTTQVHTYLDQVNAQIANVNVAVEACYDKLTYTKGAFDPASVQACHAAVSAVQPVDVPPSLYSLGGTIEIDNLYALDPWLGSPATHFVCGMVLGVKHCTQVPNGIQSTSDGGQYEEFVDAKGNPSAIYWSPDTDAHVVYGGILQKWTALGRERGIGYPMEDERNDASGTGRKQSFMKVDPKTGEIGYSDLYWNGSSVSAIGGGILIEWNSLGTTTYHPQYVSAGLGFPITDELNTLNNDGKYNNFQNGALYYQWNNVYGNKAFPIVGEMFQAWQRSGGAAGHPETGMLGFPSGEPRVRSDNRGAEQRFVNGSVYSHMNGNTVDAHWVANPIDTFFRGNDVAWGYPTSDETPASDGMNNGYYALFVADVGGGSTIATSDASGVHMVYGGLFTHFQQGGMFGRFGFPTTEENGVESAQDTMRRWQNFTKGVMYWSGPTGAQFVTTDWEQFYLSKGGPDGCLGMPVNEVHTWNNNDNAFLELTFARQDFERGNITQLTGERVGSNSQFLTGQPLVSSCN
jgi:hypothetical protein